MAGRFGSGQPWTAENVPQSLVDILDRAAGKQHSRTGPVMHCLATILNEYDRLMSERGIAESMHDAGGYNRNNPDRRLPGVF